MTHKQKRKTIWTLAITSVALFMVTPRQPRRHDRAAGDPARPARVHLPARVDGQRLHAHVRRAAPDRAPRSATASAAGALFAIGLLLFTGASALAALATSATMLDVARAVQGVGGGDRRSADADASSRRACPPSGAALALGIWGGIGGLAVALGPLVGGAVVSGISWHWIFWLNVPIGLVARTARAGAARGDARRRLGARPARPRARQRRAARHRLGPRPRQRARLDERRHRRRRSPPASLLRRGVRRLGAARAARRCCRCASSATARSRSRTSPRC